MASPLLVGLLMRRHGATGALTATRHGWMRLAFVALAAAEAPLDGPRVDRSMKALPDGAAQAARGSDAGHGWDARRRTGGRRARNGRRVGEGPRGLRELPERPLRDPQRAVRLRQEASRRLRERKAI